MIGAPNSLNLKCKVRVMKEAPGPSVSEEIADIFRNYNIDIDFMQKIDLLQTKMIIWGFIWSCLKYKWMFCVASDSDVFYFSFFTAEVASDTDVYFIFVL